MSVSETSVHPFKCMEFEMHEIIEQLSTIHFHSFTVLYKLKSLKWCTYVFVILSVDMIIIFICNHDD